MAYSGSVKRSQDILACGLCETETKINVKCMDCDLYMCQKCTDKVHAKFKNADLHDIVALKDIHSHIDEVDAKSEFRPVKCKDHRKQLCCMFCITCELLVCPMCIAKSHQLHLMEEIQTICQKKVEEMKKQKNQAHTKTEKFIENLNLMAEIEKSKSNEIEKKILEDEKQAREVQLQCLGLLQEHKEMTKRHAEQISKKKSEIVEKEKEFEMVMQKVENIHKSQDTEKFLEIACDLMKNLESFEQSTSLKTFNIKTQKYIPRYKIQSNSKSLEMEIQFEIQAKYEIDMLDITSITCDMDGRIWITDGRKQIHQILVKDEFETIKSIELDHSVTEIRCLNKDVLITSTSFPEIRFLEEDNELNIFTDLSPNKAYTVHVSGNEIIVGLNCSSVKDKTDIPIIMRLGFNRKIIQVYKNHGKQLLTRDVVRCCTTVNDGAICYIDSIYAGGYIGDVVFISHDGIIQWKYHGNSFINSNVHPFTPIEVLSTSSFNLIVSDEKQHALHILTAQGELLTILNLKLLGIEEPGVMTIDVHGTLWIDSKELDKEILSSVKFSGF